MIDLFPRWKPDDELKACVTIGVVITVMVTGFYGFIRLVEWLQKREPAKKGRPEGRPVKGGSSSHVGRTASYSRG